MRRFLRDIRGAGVLAPVFIILAVSIIATVAVSVHTGGSVFARSSAVGEMSSASRSVIAAFAAELNTTPVADVSDAMTEQGDGYLPVAWIPSQTDQVTFHALTATAVGYALTFTVTSERSTVKERTFTVEFVEVPMVWVDGRWVEAAEGQTPERLVWAGARTIVGGAP